MILDYSISTPQHRVEYVNSLLKEYTPTANEISLLSDYILFTRDKNQTKAEKETEYSITTSNRKQTIDKRQVSYEGLIDKLENGEDGIYSLMSDSQEMKLDHREPITTDDIENIPGIQECMDVIKSLEKQRETATGQRKKQLKTSIIETWKQAYVIKSSYKMGLSISTNKTKYLASINIPEEIYYDKDGIPRSNSPLSLLNPEHVSFLLQYYQILKQESWELLDSDMIWHLIDLENVASKALETKFPILYDIIIHKVDKLTNKQIQERILSDYGVDHSEQYYSTVWRKRIPKLISEQVQQDYVIHQYRNDPSLQWKKCSKCGRLKPAHSLFFPKNSSKDKFYSQCKDCKNKK